MLCSQCKPPCQPCPQLHWSRCFCAPKLCCPGFCSSLADAVLLFFPCRTYPRTHPPAHTPTANPHIPLRTYPPHIPRTYPPYIHPPHIPPTSGRFSNAGYPQGDHGLHLRRRWWGPPVHLSGGLQSGGLPVHGPTLHGLFEQHLLAPSGGHWEQKPISSSATSPTSTGTLRGGHVLRFLS